MKKVKIKFKHKRMPVGYMSAPKLEITITKNQMDGSEIFTAKSQTL